MKNYLILLLMLSISVSIYAQDVIVRKDGSTIIAKVLSVGIENIEYKKWSNQDGPTYTLAKSELLSINYANGEKDTFGEPMTEEIAMPVEISAPSVFTQEDITHTVNQTIYKSTAGRGELIAGGISLATGLSGIVGGVIFLCASEGTIGGVSLAVGAGLTGLGWGLVESGKHKKKEAYAMQQFPIFRHEFKIGDYALSPSVDIYTNQLTKKKGIGAGLCLNF